MTTMAECGRLYDEAKEVAFSDALASLRLAEEAYRLIGMRCLKVRCLALIVTVSSELGQLDRAEATLVEARGLALECPCCNTILDRGAAALASHAGQHDKAKRLANRAVAISSSSERPVSLLYRACVLKDAGNSTDAVADYCSALPSLETGLARG
jgi:hypothetical protein